MCLHFDLEVDSNSLRMRSEVKIAKQKIGYNSCNTNKNEPD